MADPTAQPVTFPGDAPSLEGYSSSAGGFLPPRTDAPTSNMDMVSRMGPGAGGAADMGPVPPPKQQSTLKKILLGVFDSIALSQGFPTHYDYQRRELADQRAKQQMDIAAMNAQTNQAAQAEAIKWRQMQQTQATPQPLSPDNPLHKWLGMPEGQTVMLTPAQFQAAIGERARSGVHTEQAIQKARVMEGLREGVGIPVPPDLAQQIGRPDLAGVEVGKAGWSNINAALGAQGKNLKVTDIGDKRVLFNTATNEVVKVLGTAPGLTAGIARAWAFGAARAHYAPFQTSDEQGNPITISAEQAIATGAPALNVWNSVYGPTSTTKSSGQFAGAIIDHIEPYKAAIKNLAAKGQLGPVMGRLNTYLTEGYGGNDPDVSEFITTTGLMNSAAVRAHFGARGGAQILETFNKKLNTAQTPEALIGSVNAIGSFMRTYKDIGIANPPKTSIPARGGARAKPTHRFNPDTGKIEAIP